MKDELFVSVIGAGRCDAATYALAEEVGRELAQHGATVICGGLGTWQLAREGNIVPAIVEATSAKDAVEAALSCIAG